MIATWLCVAALFCAPVTARVGNPPAEIAWSGLTQATLTWPGYEFGPIFLAHVGTPEGWGFYDVRLGDAITVDGKAYTVTSIRQYRSYRNGWMVDLETGEWLTNLEAYALNQSAPNISLETCIPDPKGMTGPYWQEWGRLFITAAPTQ